MRCVKRWTLPINGHRCKASPFSRCRPPAGAMASSQFTGPLQVCKRRRPPVRSRFSTPCHPQRHLRKSHRRPSCRSTNTATQVAASDGIPPKPTHQPRRARRSHSAVCGAILPRFWHWMSRPNQRLAGRRFAHEGHEDTRRTAAKRHKIRKKDKSGLAALALHGFFCIFLCPFVLFRGYSSSCVFVPFVGRI